MRTSGHLHSTTIALVFILHFNTSVTVFEGLLFLIGSIFLDGDYIIAKMVFKVENHRNFITHSTIFYFVLIFFTILLHSFLFWLFAGSLFHLVFDVFDWGLPLLPNRFFTPHLLEVPVNKKEIYFFQAYFENKIILSLELLFLVGFIFSLFFLNYQIVAFAIFLEICVIGEFLFQLNGIYFNNV